MTVGTNLFFIAALLLTLILTGTTVRADTSLNGLGDIGCNDTAKKNLANLAASKTPVLGAGDYRYDCKGETLKPLWDKIPVKHGVYGNHDVENTTSKTFTKYIMGISDKGWYSWKLNDIAIIGINVYQDFKKGSIQNDYIKLKSDQFCGRNDINWVIYSFHEPFNTPTVIGGHGPNKAVRSEIGPIIAACDKTENVLVVEGHNHITAFGNIDGINHAVCGGGGKGGDGLGNLNGFEYGSTKPGYCDFSFTNTTATVQHVGTDNKIVKEFAFY